MPEKMLLRPSVGLGSELGPERVGVGGGGQREAVAFRAAPGARVTGRTEGPSGDRGTFAGHGDECASGLLCREAQGHAQGSGFSRHLPVVLGLRAEAELEIQVRSWKAWFRLWSAREGVWN